MTMEHSQLVGGMCSFVNEKCKKVHITRPSDFFKCPGLTCGINHRSTVPWTEILQIILDYYKFIDFFLIRNRDYRLEKKSINP